MALALHAQRFAAIHGGTHRSIVIDHGIRPGSEAEAARVVTRLEASGIPADYIRVQSPAPSTGLQEWARMRRYEHLLAEARRDRACLLVGQHAGDQVETVMMRLARGSGLAGLAGMRPVTMREGVPVIRPLLGAGRAAIIASCHRHA
ncbi:MAG: tRNA lysidine(34) synthetase, partial [Pseudomonadota bacterium]|nr:tRNA lysidine(34) synthetase [Pseudomonadota bacterium]